MNKIIEITEVLSNNAGAYDAGDAIGTLIEFENAASVYKGYGVIRKLTVIDLSKQSAVLDLHLFNQTFTPTADDAVFDPSDADMAHSLGAIHVAAADWDNCNDSGVATVECYFPFVLVADGSSLFGQLSCVGTPTFAAIGDVTVKLTIER